MAEMTSLDQCFQSDLYRQISHLTVGVKPYLPGITIGREHSFVKRMEDWKLTYGKTPKSERTPDVIRAHPGNPLAVIEGKDNIDYVLHDKSEGGTHFADQHAKDLADAFLWDLGEGLAETGAGLLEKYWQRVIMKPTDGSRREYKYDKGRYEQEYSKQRSAKLAREQLPDNIKGKSTEDVIAEVMLSSMVVESLRQKLGYYELSTNDRFENVSDRVLKELMAVDGNHLSGTDDVSLSPLFLQRILDPQIAKKKGSSVGVSTSFNYGFGKLFKKSNIRTTRGCRPSKFNKGLNVNCLRRVGLACPSYIGLGGTFVLNREEIAERKQILQNNQELIRERMLKAGMDPPERRQIYGVGNLDLVRRETNDQATENTGPAHFVLFSRTKLHHRCVLPFVLTSEMIKSELVTYLTLLRIIDAQMRSPLSYRHEKDPLNIGERTVIEYQRLVETLYPCKAWWGDGTIISGERWKMTTMSLFSFYGTKLTPSIWSMRQALDIDDQDERTNEVFEKIQKECDTTAKPYMFLPVMQSKSLVFTRDDSVFVQNNKDNILKEREVSKLFKLRDERKEGMSPTTVVSAVVSMGAFEITVRDSQGSSTRVRMKVDLQQPSSKLLKAETIRVYCVNSNVHEEEEPDYDVKIEGYLDALKILAFRRDNTTLTRDNIEEYMEDMGLSDQEREDVIHRLVQEIDSDQEDPPDDTTLDTKRWKNRDDVHPLHDDAPPEKRGRFEDME